MYKWLVVAIISIFILAFVFRQCTDVETSVDLYESINADINIKDTVVIKIESEKTHSLSTQKLGPKGDCPWRTDAAA